MGKVKIFEFSLRRQMFKNTYSLIQVTPILPHIETFILEMVIFIVYSYEEKFLSPYCDKTIP